MTNWRSYIDPNVGDGQDTIDGIIANGPTYGIQISDDLNVTGLSTFSDIARFSSTIRLDGQLRDGDNAFGTSGQVLSSDGTDTRWVNAAQLSAGAAAQIAINADNSTNTSRFITFVNSSSGNNDLKTDTGLTYNPSSNDVFTTGDIVSGRGSGGVALTINDGYGNANVTWNHQDGIPEQNGNAARIEVNTDSTSGATMFFELKSNVSSGSAVQTINVLDLLETQIKPHKNIIPNSDSSISIGSDSVRFSNGYFDTVYGSGANLTSINATNISSGTLNTARLPNTYTKAAGVVIQSTGSGNDVHLDAADHIILEAGEEEDGAIYFRGNSGADSYRFSKSGQTTHEGFLSFENISADRTYTFPNVSGTVALTSSTVANATTLANSRNFSISGDITASAVSFNGSGNVSLSATIDTGVVDYDNLQASNRTTATNGQYLRKQSGNTGGMTWEDVPVVTGGNLTGNTLASGIVNSSLTSLGALSSLNCDGAADFDGGQVNIRYDHASTPALYVRNNTTYNQIIARFVGNSASLDIENISTGDYFFGHPTQHNGFQFFDTTGGVDIVYNNTVSVEFDSGNNFGDFKGVPSVNGVNLARVSDNITGTSGGFTAGNASNLNTGTIPAARVPTLNQNTTGSSGSFTAGNASNLNSGTVNTARLPITYTKADRVTIQSTGAGHDVLLDAADHIILESGEEEDGSIYFRGNSGADSYRFSKSGQTAIEGYLSFESMSADRTYTFPNKTGTVAMTSDVTQYTRTRLRSFTSNTTYTPTSGTKSIIVYCIAGGGGGGNASGDDSGEQSDFGAASGGGGGGCSIGQYTLGSGFTAAITIGGGGSGGSSGGESRFNPSSGNTIQGNGGSAGGQTTGGGGGSASGTGALNCTGHQGNNRATSTSGGQYYQTPGNGGVAGYVFGTKGSGGNGGGPTGGQQAGQSGTAGIVVIYEYIHT